MRVAAIDVGTNSVHLIVAELRPDGSFRILDSQKEMVQLGRGEFASRRLAPDAAERALASLASFKRICAGHEVSRVLAVATSAVREASNGGDFIEEVARRTGIHVRVITGEDEGRLIYRAIRHYVEIGDRRVVAVDIGGGSVELILGAGPRPIVVDSLKLGHIRLADLLEGDPPSPESVEAVRTLCRRTLARVSGPYTRSPVDLVVGTSGTIESFARMDLEGGKNGRETHLHVVDADAVRRLTKKLLKLDASERRKVPGLDEGRVATIAAGGLVLQEVLEALGAPSLTACAAALREGLILDYLDRARDRIRREDALPDVRLRSVNELLHRAQGDTAHAAHVSRLALELFDDLAPLHGLEPECRQLLHVAAVLHDVGLHVEHRRHQRHSYYLIVHGGLRGFTAREIEIVANVARYHRKSLPRAGHPEFARLRKGDQRRVRVLAALLRIADGLDRGHNQVVEAVHCQVQDGRATFHVLSWHDAEIELWGARRKSDLFELAFEAEPEFKLERPDEAPDAERAGEVLAAAEPGLQAG
ncbi:MAG TPA: Ppx/GppA phosphatase family protein [Gemmatimonadota bacterium]|jgi:exopolyphosphatase/guanosine-5'-triphosphate,3'-diphosphate pyrophosphatase